MTTETENGRVHWCWMCKKPAHWTFKGYQVCSPTCAREFAKMEYESMLCHIGTFERLQRVFSGGEQGALGEIDTFVRFFEDMCDVMSEDGFTLDESNGQWIPAEEGA